MGVKKFDFMKIKHPVSISLEEILSLKAAIMLGKMFTKPEDKKKVQAFLSRTGVGLIKRGFPKETVEEVIQYDPHI